jgi:hypothetical protein
MRAARALAGAVLWTVLATTPKADTSFLNLSDAEREILGQTIRDVLVTTPGILRVPSARPAPDYAAKISNDQALIRRHHEALFSVRLPGAGPQTAKLKVALLTSPTCTGCARAEADLHDLANHHDLRVFVIDVTQHGALVESLGADTLPFYVLPQMMLRGQIPRVVLDRYLSDATGQ